MSGPCLTTDTCELDAAVTERALTHTSATPEAQARETTSSASQCNEGDGEEGLSAESLLGLAAAWRLPWRHLSPAVGALLAASPILQHVLERAPHESAMYKLLRELFHQPTRGEALRLSRNKSKAVYYATVPRLALWLALYVSDRLDDATLYAELTEQWYRECRCSRSSLLRLTHLLARAEAEATLFWPHCGVGVVLAATWMRMSTRADIVAYTDIMARFAPQTLVDVAAARSVAGMRGTLGTAAMDLLSVKLSQWRESAQWERTAVALLEAQFSAFPAPIEGATCSIDPLEGERPDCGERGVRCLITFALWDPYAQQLDLARLEGMGASAALVDFFATSGMRAQREPSVATGRAASNAWYKLVAAQADSGHGISYLRKCSRRSEAPHELRPGKRNFLRLLRALFPARREELKLDSWTEVGALLSSTWCRVSIVDERPSDDGGKVQVSAVHVHSASGARLKARAELRVSIDTHTYWTPSESANTKHPHYTSLCAALCAHYESTCTDKADDEDTTAPLVALALGGVGAAGAAQVLRSLRARGWRVAAYALRTTALTSETRELLQSVAEATGAEEAQQLSLVLDKSVAK